MTVNVNKLEDTIELMVTGRLDTTTAPQLETLVKAHATGTKQMVLDLNAVDYISSAGLRVVLVAHKLMAGLSGKLIIRNPSAFCMQVFNATGMNGVLFIQ